MSVRTYFMIAAVQKGVVMKKTRQPKIALHYFGACNYFDRFSQFTMSLFNLTFEAKTADLRDE